MLGKLLRPIRKTSKETQNGFLDVKNTSSHEHLPGGRFRLLSWNVYKGRRKGFHADFKKISGDVDLILLQEVTSSPKMLDALSHGEDHGWEFSRAYELVSGVSTGVATASRAKPVATEAIISEVCEPFIRTPKSLLATTYCIEGRSEKLMVMNVHAINFVKQSDFVLHMRQMVATVSLHEGPVIVAGDINTWSRARLKFVAEELKVLGIEWLAGNTMRGMCLDHVFGRGVKVVRDEDMDHINTSDHKPLLLDMEFC